MDEQQWKVIRAGDGRLAAVDYDKPSRPVLYTAPTRTGALKYIELQEKRMEDARQYVRILIPAFIAAAIAAGLVALSQT